VGRSEKHPNLLFNAEELDEIRQKISRYEWARQLFERLKTAVDGGEEPFTLGGGRYTMQHPAAEISSFPDEGESRGLELVHESRVHEIALVGALSGDPKYARRVRELLIVLAEVLPRTIVWALCHDELNLLVAYDLVYDEPGWTDPDRQKVESAFIAVMEQILVTAPSRHLCNTAFYYQPYKVFCGCFFGRQDWIDAGLKGRGGLYEVLQEPVPMDPRWYINHEEGSPHHTVQRHGLGTVDGMLWYESGIYCGVMLAQYCLIAEAMRHYDGTDIWNYEAPGGGSIRGMFNGLVIRAFNDGEVALFGENGMYDRRHEGFDEYITSGLKLFNLPKKHIAQAKFDLAYARYKDPGYGWLALQDPERSDWDGKLGYCALWYGHDASEMEVSPPDVRSHTFKNFRTAMIRSTEGPEFWTAETPTIAVTWGPGTKYRAHPDQFSFTLYAMGKVLEPDLVTSWDYGVPQSGRNPTPLTASSWVHNVLIVDGRNHGMAPGDLVIDDYGEHIKVLGLAGNQIHPGSPHESVEMGRWLGLTKEYLLDVVYISWASVSHRFDLVVPAYGELSIPGVDFEEYDLGADLGFGKIDTASDHPENRWITEGKKARAPESWTALFHNPDGVNLAVHSTGWDTGELLTGRIPLCWAPYLEQMREEPEPLRGRYNILLHRKSVFQGDEQHRWGLLPGNEDHCHYFVVHEPFRDKPRVRSVRRVPLSERKATLWDPFGHPFSEDKLTWTTPRVMEVKTDEFTDYFVYVDHFTALRGGEPGRAVLETPAFRLEFSGPYAYLKVSEGELVAQQGDIRAVEVIS